MNTPMLLRALTYRNLSLAETREKALAGGVQGCLRVD
ncbi:PTS system IIa component [Bordetella pertussis]|nr:PTS system IIa component [Bordetella pertussis]